METEVNLVQKWEKIIDSPSCTEIKDRYRKNVTAVLLENYAREAKVANGHLQYLREDAPTNSTGNAIDNYDPIMISLIRRSMPNLIAYDVCGVQPMTGPTGLIFAMKSRYMSQTGNEALYNEADTDFSGGVPSGDTPFAKTNASAGVFTGNGDTRAASATAANHFANAHVAQDPFSSNYSTGQGMTTAQGEALGSSSNPAFAEMGFSIDKVSVTAKTRALKAEYSVEMAQDLKAIHGLDAEAELANILSTEILAEINREVIRSIFWNAEVGAQTNTTTAGTFDLDTDSNGRWSVEKFKGLLFQVERDANQIAKRTRRGKGNIAIVSSDVASALSMAGILDYAPAMSTSLNVDDTGNTFAGVLQGRIRVYIDPYFSGAGGAEFVCLGYRGGNQYDAGLFYCPYVGLQMARAIGQDTFQPKIAFRTRYAIAANPFNNDNNPAESALYVNSNKYYRKFKVTNLM